MNEVMQAIRHFRTANFCVTVDAMYPSEMLDLSWDDDGSVREGLESGKYVAFDVCARVIHADLGELAVDYLGQCIYESPAAFMDHKEAGIATRKLRAAGDNAVCGSYFSDMVANVCEEARKRLLNMRHTVAGLRIREVQS